jgi:hypothetical protein
MTGQTHLALGSAVGGTVLVAAGIRVPVHILFGAEITPAAGAQLAAAAGLLTLCLIGTLFPDLDSPESELAHAPHKVTQGMSRTTRAALGLRSRSLSGGLVGLVFGGVGLLGGAIMGALSLFVRSFTHHRGFTHELRGCLLFTALVMIGTALLSSLLHLPLLALLSTTLLVGAVWMLGYLTHLLADAATRAGIPLLGAGHPFHLLPPGRRVRTGTLLDTMLLRWAAWIWVLGMLVLAARP